MNKSILYILIAGAVGLGLGYLLFTNNDNQESISAEVGHEHTGSDAAELYTCSMHPQIIREEPGDCPICGMDLVKKETESSGLKANQFTMTKNAIALAGVQTLIIGSKTTTGTNTTTLSGRIAINENATATQPAHFNGRIESLAIRSLGQEVSKGQRIATIYSPELVAAQQELITAAKMKATQPKLYSAVRSKFNNLKIHGQLLDQIEQSGEVVTRFPIYSHVSGVVTEIAVNEGDHIVDGKAIFKVSNLATIWAEFDVYERQIDQFKEGMLLSIETNAYPNRSFEGEISFIDPILNTQTRTVTIRVILNNKEGLFKPGMFVSARVDSSPGTSNSELSIPASAVMWTGERSLVYVKPNPKETVFEMREVRLGQKAGGNYTIVSGLSVGEEIVVNGTFTVDAAAQLGGKKSMMNSGIEDEQLKSKENKVVFSEANEAALNNTITGYLKLTEAFVESNPKRVSESATDLKSSFNKVNLETLPNSAKMQVTKITKMLNAIINAKTIASQRENFVILNENMAAIVNNLNNLKPALYLQRCPMANNSEGAVWLSTSEKIINPYYTDTMRNCGSVISKFGT